MSEVYVFGLLLPFAVLAWYSRRWAVLALFAALSAYVIRTDFWGIPTTWLELGIYITFAVWLIKKDWLRLINNNFLALQWLVPLLLWLTACLLGVLVASDVRLALGVLKGFIVDPLLLMIMLVTVAFKYEVNQLWREVWAALLFGAVITTLLALLQWWLTQAERLQSGYDSPNVLAMYLAPIFVGGVLWLSNQFRNYKIARLELAGWMIGLLIIGVGIVLTNSYSAMVAVLAAIVIGLSIALRVQLAPYIGLFIILLSWLTPFLMLLFNQNILVGHANKIYGTTSSEVRLVLWQKAAEFIKERPFIGLGLGQWQSEFTLKARQQNLLSIRNPGLAIELYYSSLYPHNLWLTTWLATGLIGLVALAVIAYVVFWSAKITAMAWPAAMLGVQILHGTLDTPVWKNDLAILWWLPVVITYIIYLRQAKVFA